jgi:hypothetical protein
VRAASRRTAWSSVGAPHFDMGSARGLARLLPASLATRACQQQRRLRLPPWRATWVPHRGRPGRQRGSRSRRASGCGCRTGDCAPSRSTERPVGHRPGRHRQRHRRDDAVPAHACGPSPGLREMGTAPAAGPGSGDGSHPACPRCPAISRTGRTLAPHPRKYDRGLKVMHLRLHGIALVCIPWWPPPRPVSSAWRTGFPSSLRVSGCGRLHPGMYSPHRSAGHHRSPCRLIRTSPRPSTSIDRGTWSGSHRALRTDRRNGVHVDRVWSDTGGVQNA